MFWKRKYVYNKHTKLFEVHRLPIKRYLQGGFTMFVVSVCLFFVYMFIYQHYFGGTLPKTLDLQFKSIALKSKLELLEKEMASKDEALQELQLRDNNVYRPIYGLEEIPAQERNSSISSPGRYDSLDIFIDGDYVRQVERTIDMLYKKAYVQTLSYDEVLAFAIRSDDMARCVPAIPPVNMDRVRLVSRFGYRSDPFTRAYTYHSGIDLSGRRGEHIHATGDGTVCEVGRVFHGYGIEIVVNHGFGYKTRYAHLNRVYVKLGDKVSRGDYIGDLGNTGRSTGPHLHYEVIYRGNRMNPLNYFDTGMKGAEYRTLISDTPVSSNVKK